MNPRLLSRSILPRLEERLREPLWAHRLRRIMRRIEALPDGRVPGRTLLSQLRSRWGNEGFAAELDFLETVAHQALLTRGPILECGSGVTTLLLGVLAVPRGVEVWTLEHSPEWYARVKRALRRCCVEGVKLCLAPLREYAGFWWYDPPSRALPEHFALVVCDGPPGSTPGGRYGLFPVVGRRLPRGAVILLDDAGRPGEALVLERWQKNVGLLVEFHDRPTRSFACLTRA